MITPDTEIINIFGAGSPEAAVGKSPSKSVPQNLPILGLSDIVIFPGMVAPLLVETTQSIRLIDDVVAGDRFVGLVLQKKPEVDNPVPEDLWAHGCAARVLKMLKFPYITVRVLVEGLLRFHIVEYASQLPYLVARCDVLKDQAESTLELEALARNAERQFQEIIKLSPALSEQIKIAALNTEEPGKLSDLIAANLNLKLEERQRLLEMVSVKERLAHLLPLISRELEVLTLGSKIQNEVVSSMSKTQRDFFLREQIRAIQRELGDADPTTSEANALREQVEKNGLPDEAKNVALKELEKLQQMSPAVAEYTITRNYLDWLVNQPWNKFTEDKLDLERAAQILDEQHFGLSKVKDRLLEFLAVIKLKQQLKGPILCLVGPPGVGKTSLGRSVADALGRKFGRISLGGMRDEAEIRGHRRTYVGAMPGRILQTLRRVETRNPIFMLDEIDKLTSDFHGDPASALLEVLDPEQNTEFRDNYLEVAFDLSQVFFITTANTLETIPGPLRDRMEIIFLSGYTESEKIAIAKGYLIPRQIRENSLRENEVTFTDDSLRKIIREYTREAGVRNLERKIGAVCRKVATRIAEGKLKKEEIT